MFFENKIQNIYNKLLTLLSLMKKINAKTLNNIPNQIEKLSTGVNKLPLHVDRSISVMTVNEFKDAVKIGSHVFYKHPNLTVAAIPGKITSIDREAFRYCENLTSISILNGVTSIGSQAFANCRNLSNISISDSITSIGSNAFYDTAYYNTRSNWDDDNIMLYIGNHLVAVRNTLLLDTAYVKPGTKTLADNVFDSEDFKGIIIPDSVTNIGIYAFSQSLIENIIIPDSVTNIGVYAFERCTRLKNVTFGNGITTIASRLFANCTMLDTVIIPNNSVTSIGSQAFLNCKQLSYITIPDSVIIIEDSAFYNCEGLQNITIPHGVTTIGNNAFSYCNPIKITIPDSVTIIGIGAFYGCESLTNMYMYPTTPPTLVSKNAISTATTTIHVPIGSGSTYKSATNWSEHADKIVEDIPV